MSLLLASLVTTCGEAVAGDDPAAGEQSDACVPAGPWPAALLGCRNWIAFAPPPPFDPDRGIRADPDTIRAALRQLHAEGWRGLITYASDPAQGLDVVPRIAKEVGFTSVIAGLFWFDDAQLERERTAVLAQLQWIDGFVLGNEGLNFGRYGCDRLATEMDALRSATGRAVLTNEPLNQYLDNGLCPARLIALGDAVLANVHPWWAAIRSPAQATAFVADAVRQLRSRAGSRAVILKEVWWPTAGEAGASESAQREFFAALAASNAPFVWGEAYDQPWKARNEGLFGAHWGLHTAQRAPKTIIAELASTYRAHY
jgi:exo-beta-1,3-glucanase (GH17 family)